MAVKKVTVTEDEVWAEIDEFVSSSEKRPDEYAAKYFQERYGKSTKVTKRMLEELEKSGKVTSRIALYDSHWQPVYTLVKE